MSTDLAVPTRALAIGAHPDDIEFGCGATLAKWADAGCEIHLLVLTDGSKGTWDAQADIAQLITTREGEQRAAARVLNAHEVHFLRHVDGELASSLRERAQVCEVIRRTKPNVVLGHDPWKQYRLHPDHRHAGRLAVEGIVAARDPFFFQDQNIERHRPDELLLFEAEVVDHNERIDEHHLTRKIDALLAHESQWISTHGINDEQRSQRDHDIAMFRNRLRDDAISAVDGTTTDCTFAEAFKRMSDL